MKDRVSPKIEDAVVKMAEEFPAYGRIRTSNELRKAGILVSGGGVRSIWQRYNMETFKQRLVALEEKAAKEGIVYTEAQLSNLEASKRSRESAPDQIETKHPGYLVSQDSFYVGYLKSVGRIYQQTAIDTFSSLGLAKLYKAKVPLTAAGLSTAVSFLSSKKKTHRRFGFSPTEEPSIEAPRIVTLISSFCS